MKKLLALTVVLSFMVFPCLARTKYDKYGAKIPKQTVKKEAPAAATAQNTADEQKEQKVNKKHLSNGKLMDIGTAVRDGDTNNFTVYDGFGRKAGKYVEDEKGNGKYYDNFGMEQRLLKLDVVDEK